VTSGGDRSGPGRRAAAAGFGLSAAGLALAVPVAGACADPDYSHVSQFISELGARGAPHATLVAAAGFAPIGALVLAFLGLASEAFPPSSRKTAGLLGLATVGAAYLASALFPCDPGCPSEGSFSQSVHNLFGLLEYLGAIAGLLLLSTALRGAACWRPLAASAAVCATLAALGFLCLLLPRLGPIRGAGQRLAEAAIFFWIAHASIALLRRRRESEKGAPA